MLGQLKGKVACQRDGGGDNTRSGGRQWHHVRVKVVAVAMVAASWAGGSRRSRGSRSVAAAACKRELLT